MPKTAKVKIDASAVVAELQSLRDEMERELSKARRREQEAFDKRVREFAMERLLDLANTIVTRNNESVKAFTLAGCRQEDLPSSKRVIDRAVRQIRDLAQSLVPYPIPGGKT